MTDRQMIEAYIPSPPDSSLQFGEYFVEDMRGRAVKVHIRNIAFDRYGDDIYQVFTEAERMVHGPWETDSETMGGSWYHKSALYDNKTDCLNSTHSMWNRWEELRELQKR